MAKFKTGKEVEKDPELHIEIIKQMITLATSGFGFVAALAWNNVIQEFVKNYVSIWLPKGGGLASLLLYAVIITILAVFVTYQLSKLLKLQMRKNK